MVKKSISALKPKSEKILLKKMDLNDLRTMAILAGDVIQGKTTVEYYREKEMEMIVKYEFTVKGM